MAAKPKPAPKSKTTKTSEVRTASRAATKSKPATKTKPAAKSTKPAPKTAAKAAPKESTPRGEMNLHGYIDGTDSALIAQALIEGGTSRAEVVENATALIEKANGLQTRNGTDKAITSMTSGILKGLEERGYTIESSFRVVPPAAIQEQMKKEAAAAKRAAARKAKSSK